MKKDQKINKIALVTGASRGIGAAIALDLAKNNMFVIGTATSDNGVKKIEESFKASQQRGVGLVLNVKDNKSIETLISYVQGKRKTTLFVAIGLGLLGFGEFIGWYSFVFPETILYSFSIIAKIIGLIAIGIPVSKIPLRKVSFDENL